MKFLRWESTDSLPGLGGVNMGPRARAGTLMLSVKISQTGSFVFQVFRTGYVVVALFHMSKRKPKKKKQEPDKPPGTLGNSPCLDADALKRGGEQKNKEEKEEEGNKKNPP